MYRKIPSLSSHGSFLLAKPGKLVSLWNFSLGKNHGPELADWVFYGGPKNSKNVISYKNLKLVIHMIEIVESMQEGFSEPLSIQALLQRFGRLIINVLYDGYQTDNPTIEGTKFLGLVVESIKARRLACEQLSYYAQNIERNISCSSDGSTKNQVTDVLDIHIIGLYNYP
ncbi:hypothetical protein C5167_041943 [Papaver somniferum]|nr:hypothetical protein C5167_041943 [Papaver somniferum]